MEYRKGITVKSTLPDHIGKHLIGEQLTEEPKYPYPPSFYRPNVGLGDLGRTGIISPEQQAG